MFYAEAHRYDSSGVKHAVAAGTFGPFTGFTLNFEWDADLSGGFSRAVAMVVGPVPQGNSAKQWIHTSSPCTSDYP